MYTKKICLIVSCQEGGFRTFTNNLIDMLSSKGYFINVLLLSRELLHFSNASSILHLDLNKVKNKYKSKKFFVLYHFSRCIFYFRNKNRNNLLQFALLSSQINNARKCIDYSNVIDLTEYDCVISTEEILCNYFLANNTKAKKKIGYIHPDYKMAHFNPLVDKYFLKKLDYICGVSVKNGESIATSIPSIAHKVIGIPNPINVDAIIEKGKENIEEVFDNQFINIITVCRLDNCSKALDRLLMIIKTLKENDKNFVWRIIGNGPYQKEMISFIKNNNLEKYVILVGYKDNPIPYVAKSDLFVLQSYYEGFPYSVMESLIVNTPAVITNYPAAKEQIVDGVTGYIVENDFDSILSKINFLIDNRYVIKSLKNNLLKMDKSSFCGIDKLLKLIDD